MSQTFVAQAAELRADGPRRFAQWNAELFDAVAAGPATTLRERLGEKADADAVTGNYLRLVQQAVGTGLVKQLTAGPAGWSSFLERLVIDVLPAKLPDVPAKSRPQLLVDAWNLGEGLLREPAWVDRYVNACVAGLGKLDKLEEFLVRTLAPVLRPPKPANWAGKYRLNVLDLRAVHDEFLPGKLRLAAPTVLCVEDRRKAGLQIGVLLKPGDESQLLGVVSGLGEYAETGPLPKVEFADGKATVAGKVVPIPTLRRCHGFAVARAGFVAACAPDSQRLWVIECE